MPKTVFLPPSQTREVGYLRTQTGGEPLKVPSIVQPLNRFPLCTACSAIHLYSTNRPTVRVGGMLSIWKLPVSWGVGHVSVRIELIASDGVQHSPVVKHRLTHLFVGFWSWQSETHNKMHKAIHDIQDTWLFQCKIDFYFTHEHQKCYFHLNTKSGFSLMEIPLLVYMSEK